MKKYYGYFVYKDEEYVIMFRIDGSLQWNDKYRCFMDNRWYVRSYADMICYAALDTNPSNNKSFGFACGLTHKGFKEERARGVKRWKPQVEVIKWD